MANAVIDYIRAKTGDERPDDELVAELSQRYPKLAEVFPEFGEEVNRIRKQQEEWFKPEPADPTLGDRAVHAKNALVQGAARGVGAIGKSIARTADYLDRNVLDLTPGSPEPENRLLYQGGQALIDKSGEAFPMDPRLQDSFWLTDVPQGVGNVGANLLVSGGAGAALGRGGAFVASTLAGAGMEFDDAFERSLERGDDPDTAFAKSLGYGTIAAAIEAKFGAGRLVRKYFPTAVDAAANLARKGVTTEVIKDFVAGYGEEFAQRTIQDLVVDGQTGFSGANREGLAGGIVQSLIGIPANLRGRRGKGHLDSTIKEVTERRNDDGSITKQTVTHKIVPPDVDDEGQTAKPKAAAEGEGAAAMLKSTIPHLTSTVAEDPDKAEHLRAMAARVVAGVSSREDRLEIDALNNPAKVEDKVAFDMFLSTERTKKDLESVALSPSPATPASTAVSPTAAAAATVEEPVAIPSDDPPAAAPVAPAGSEVAGQIETGIVAALQATKADPNAVFTPEGLGEAIGEKLDAEAIETLADLGVIEEAEGGYKFSQSIVDKAKPAAPAATPTLEQDIAAYREADAELQAINAQRDKLSPHEFADRLLANLKKREPIKNRYGYPPPGAVAENPKPSGVPSTPVEEDRQSARAETKLNPTEKEKESGKYPKGEFEWQGFNLKIETPIGTTRKGRTKAGKEWSVVMPADYGEFSSLYGADGDKLDFMAGPDLSAPNVTIIDQYTEDGKFDEHKVFVGFASEADALNAFDKSFSDGSGPRRRQNAGASTAQTIPVEGFKAWTEQAKLATKPSKKPALYSDDMRNAAVAVLREGSTSNASSQKGKQEALQVIFSTPTPEADAQASWQAGLEKRRTQLQTDLARLAKEMETLGKQFETENDKLAKEKDAEKKHELEDTVEELKREILAIGNTGSIIQRKLQAIEQRGGWKLFDIGSIDVENITAGMGRGGRLGSRQVYPAYYTVEDKSESASQLAAAQIEALNSGNMAPLGDILTSQSSAETDKVAKTNTRRSVILSSPDGKFAVTTVFRQVNPRKDASPFYINYDADESKRKGNIVSMPIEDALAAGWRVFGSIRTDVPLNNRWVVYPDRAAFDADFGDAARMVASAKEVGAAVGDKIVEAGFDRPKSDEEAMAAMAAEPEVEQIEQHSGPDIFKKEDGQWLHKMLKRRLGLANLKANLRQEIRVMVKDAADDFRGIRHRIGERLELESKLPADATTAATAINNELENLIAGAFVQFPANANGFAGALFSAGSAPRTKPGSGGSAGSQPASQGVQPAANPPVPTEPAQDVAAWKRYGFNPNQPEVAVGDVVRFAPEPGATPVTGTVTAVENDIALKTEDGREVRRANAMDFVKVEKPQVSPNKLVTKEQYEQAKANLRAKLGGGRVGTSPDPTVLKDLVVFGVYHAEAGARKFAAWAKAMITDLGDAVKPWLRAIYEGVRTDESLPADAKAQMDSTESVVLQSQQLGYEGTPQQSAPAAQPEAVAAPKPASQPGNAGVPRPDQPAQPEGRAGQTSERPQESRPERPADAGTTGGSLGSVPSGAAGNVGTVSAPSSPPNPPSNVRQSVPPASASPEAIAYWEKHGKVYGHPMRPGRIIADEKDLPAPKGYVAVGQYPLADADQVFGINLALTNFIDNGRRAFMLADGTGFGKAQPLDAKIATPTGWKRMGDIAAGDIVLAGDGTKTTVTGIFPQGEKEIFRVVTSDGATTECCDDHLWLTRTWRDRNKVKSRGSVKPLSVIRQGLMTVHGQANHTIPVTAAHYDERPTEMAPYLMGALLGDGCFASAGISVSSGDAEIIDHIKRLLPPGITLRKKGKYDYSITGGMPAGWTRGYNPIRTAIKMNGLYGCKSEKKFVPPAYKFNSMENRISVLRGLMDTDGFVSKNGMAVEFYSVSEQLAQDVAALTRSLGGTAKVHLPKIKTFTHLGEKRTGQPCYRVSVKTPFCPFLLKRKVERWRPTPKYAPARYISSVESVGFKPAQCIMVDHPSHLYITDDFIVTHNTIQELIVAQEYHRRTGKRVLFVTENAAIRDTRIVAEAKKIGITDTGFLDLSIYGDIRANVARNAKTRNVVKPRDQDYGLIIADECFVAGTMIQLADGTTKSIEEIQVGDKVRNAAGIGDVEATMVRQATSLCRVRTALGDFTCTPNHPVLTQAGWVLAGQLNQSHYIKTHEQSLRILQGGTSGKAGAFLRQILFSEMEAEPTGEQAALCGAIISCEALVRTQGGARQKSKSGISVQNAHEGEQPNAQCLCEAEGGKHAFQDGAWANRAWWKRNRANQSRGHNPECLPVGIVELGRKDRRRNRLSKQLQNRRGLSGDSAGGGVRWEFTQRAGAPVSGSQEGSQVEGIRVAGVEAVQQKDFHRYGGDSGVTVYNLQIGGHPSYVLASGAVVHNCHNLKTPGSQQTIAFQRIKADKLMFATATPMDRPEAAIYFLGELSGSTPAEVADRMGGMLVEKVSKEGNVDVVFEKKEGVTWQDVETHVILMRNVAVRRGSFIRREYPMFGEINRMDMTIDEDVAREEQEAIDAYYEAKKESAHPRVRGRYEGQKLMELGRWAEGQKVDFVFEKLIEDIGNGHRVVVFAETAGEEITLKGLGRVDEGFIYQLEQRLAKMRKAMIETGEPDAKRFAKLLDPARIYGDNEKGDEVGKFQRSEAFLTLATPKSGGAGIDLDDVFGNQPRKVYVVTANYSGDVFQQILGRVSRRNTQSPVEIFVIAATNSISDRHRHGRLNDKIDAINAITKGEVDIDKPFLFGADPRVEREREQEGGMRRDTDGRPLVSISKLPNRPGLFFVADNVKGTTYRNKEAFKRFASSQVNRRTNMPGSTRFENTVSGGGHWVFPEWMEPAFRERFSGLLGESAYRDEPSAGEATVDRALFDRVAQAAAARGVGVQLLDADVAAINGMAKQGRWWRSEDRADRIITVAMDNAFNPTVDNLVTLFHEVGHDIARESGPAIERAMRNVPPGLETEEQLVERMAKELAGVTPDSRSLVRQIIDTIKTILTDIANWFQGTSLGKHFNVPVSPGMARAWVDHQMRQFARGADALDVASFHGAHPTATGVTLWHRNDGGLVVPMRLNWADGTLEYQPLPAETAEQAQINMDSEGEVAYRDKQEVSSEKGPRDAYVAAMNITQNVNADAAIDAAVVGTDGLGMSTEEWARKVGVELPRFTASELTKRYQPILEAHPDPKLDPVRVDRNTFMLFRQIVESAGSKMARLNTRVERDRAKYAKNLAEHATLQETSKNANAVLNEQMIQPLREMVKDFAKGIRTAVKDGRRAGILEQQIKQMGDLMTQPVMDQYERILNTMAKQIAGKGGDKFMDMLMDMSVLDVDWRSMPIDSVRETLKGLAVSNSNFAVLGGDSKSSKALLAAVASFAKQNQRVMDMLALRQSKDVELQERVQEMIRNILSDSQLTFVEAKELLKKMPRQARLAGSLFNESTKFRRQQRSLQNRIRANEQKVAAYNAVRPQLDQQARLIQDRIPGSAWEITVADQEMIPIPSKPGQTMAQMPRVLMHLETGKEDLAAWMKHLRSVNEWLATAPDGIERRTMANLGKQLEIMLATQKQHQAILDNVFTRWLGALYERLLLANTPALKSAATRMLNWGSMIQKWHNQMVTAGYRANAMKDRAVRAASNSFFRPMDPRSFDEAFLDNALHFFKANDYLEAEDGGQAEALEKLKAHWEATHPAVAQMMADGRWQKFWPAFSNFITAHVKAGEIVVQAALDMGTSVSDPELSRGRRTHAVRSVVLEDGRTLSTDTWESLAAANGMTAKQLKRANPALVEALAKAGTAALRPGDTVFLPSEEFVRDVIGTSMFNAPRAVKRAMTSAVNRLVEAGVFNLPPKSGELLQLLQQNGGAEAIRQAWGNERAIRDWIEPMVNNERPMFFAPPMKDGVTQIMASPDNIAAAWEQSGGDVLEFSDRLFELEDGYGEAEGMRRFRADTVGRLMHYAHQVQSIAAESDARHAAGLGHMLMDARVADDFPNEWLDYYRFDQSTMDHLLRTMSAHAAFGRDLTAVRDEMIKGADEIQARVRRLEDERTEARRENPLERDIDGVVEKKLGKSAFAELIAAERVQGEIGWSHAHPNSTVALDTLKSFIKNDSSHPMESRFWLELVKTVASMAVQGPRSAFINTIDLFAPAWRFGTSGLGGRMAVKSVKHFLAGPMGTFGELLFKQAGKGAVFQKRLAEFKGRYPSSVVSIFDRMRAIRSTSFLQDHGLVRFLRMAREAAGGSAVGPKGGIFPRLKPFSMFTQEAEWAYDGLVNGIWESSEMLMMDAVDYMRAHPEAVADPNFRFTSDMVVKPHGFLENILFAIGNNKETFDRLRATFEQYGINLEQQARDALRTGELFKPQQLRGLMAMAQDQFSLEANPNTRAPALYNNAVLRFATPLLQWSIQKPNQLQKAAWRGADGEWEGGWQATKNSMKLFAVTAGIGLVYALWLEDYDEKVTGKKSNIRWFSADASAGDNAQAAVEMLARTGNYGLPMELANGLINYASSGDLRGISVDGRVLFLNSLFNTMSAVSTFARQKEATYATVGRPLLQAVGGSGYLQYAQAVNTMFPDAIEAEQRVTRRINIGNYLRAAGRQMNLDVRTGSGMASLPNEMKPWVGEMMLSAYADNSEDFQSAYAQAVEAAQSEWGLNRPDAERKVRDSFAAYHPLSIIFRTKPTEREYQKLLDIMPEDGRNDVSDGINLYNRFASRLGIKPSEGKQEKSAFSPAAFRNELLKSLGRDTFRFKL